MVSNSTGHRSLSIRHASFDLPPIFLHVDDPSFELYALYKELLQKPTSFAESLSSPAGVEKHEEEHLVSLADGIYIESMSIGTLSAFADIHLSTSKTGLPVAIDTERSPLSISPISVRHIALPWNALTQAVSAHILAEALLNAPLVLGSLQLFFNPTGLVRSIRKGVANMIDLPMQGLQQGPLQFIAGVGQGSVSLVREISGWSLSSAIGFGRAASNAIAGSLISRSSDSAIKPAAASLDSENSQTELPPMVYPARLPLQLPCSSIGLGEVLCFSEANNVTIHQGLGQPLEQGAFKLGNPLVVFADRKSVV